MGEFKLLPQAAVLDVSQFFKTVELTGVWPADLREMLYLQLPQDGARDAGQPVALLPQVYRLWSAVWIVDLEVPVGAGALDETFDLASFRTKARNGMAAGSCKRASFLIAPSAVKEY
eukprot:6484941-Amphidinium_carterae.3